MINHFSMKKSDHQSIQNFYQQWFGAMEQADIEGLLSLLDDEFYFKVPGQPAVQDKETLRSNFIKPLAKR